VSFCTVVNCMDGRVQLPVITYLQGRFDAEHVDSVTAAGPNLILARRAEPGLVASILRRVTLSVERHGSVGIALVGHHDCAGNPAPEGKQREHIVAGVELLRGRFPGLPVIGLWVDESWTVREVATGSERNESPALVGGD